MEKTYINWSGGKDCSLALYETRRQNKYAIDKLLTSVNAVQDRISMHGVRRALLEAQARAIGLPLTTIELPESPGMAEYESLLGRKLTELQQDNFTHAIFGDIFLEDLRAYREKQLSGTGIVALFPLWKRNTTELVKTFIALGFKAIIVCVNEQWLDQSFCGRVIDEALLHDLPDNIDPCGENGEFHSFVFDGPIFESPVAFSKGQIVYKTHPAPAGSAVPDYGFWFCDLLPVESLLQ